MVAELSDSEKEQLAKEIAADKHVGGGGYYDDNMREVFMAGWDAAVEHLRQREQELLLKL